MQLGYKTAAIILPTLDSLLWPSGKKGLLLILSVRMKTKERA